MDKPDKYAVFKCGELSEFNLVILKKTNLADRSMRVMLHPLFF